MNVILKIVPHGTPSPRALQSTTPTLCHHRHPPLPLRYVDIIIIYVLAINSKLIMYLSI
jgi:hypothetical protein